MAPLLLFLFVVLTAATARTAVRAVPLMEPKSLDHFSKPGPYHMGTMMIDAPKTSIFRQSYGYAPIAVYFPTNAPGSSVLATNETTFPAIGFAHGAGSAAEFYTGLYAHVVRNMAPIPASLGDDMCHGLAWIITESLGGGLYKQESMFYGRVDEDRVGVMGHSMGGGGSLHCAMSWPDKVKAVAPIHPAPGAPASLIYAPMMVATGALDFVTSPMMVKASVFDGSPSPKIMPIMNGVAHREPVNYAGANRWNGYLTGFFSLYLKKDSRAALLIWGEEVGSLAKDSRISVAHRNKGSVLWLESTEAEVGADGKVASVTGKLTKTIALTRGAHYTLQAFQRIENGFDVDVGFEIKSTNEWEIDFVMHVSVLRPGRVSKSEASAGQKVTVVAMNTNDGGSASFIDIFLTLGESREPGYASTPHPASHYDNQRQHLPPSLEAARQEERRDHLLPDRDRSSRPPSVVDFNEESWSAFKEERDGRGGGHGGSGVPVSGTTFTVVKDDIRGGIEGDGYESWADVLYSSSKKMQRKPKQHTLQSLQQSQARREQHGGGSGGRSDPNRSSEWGGQLFPASSSNIPTSLLPWGSIISMPGDHPQARESVVLGVSDYPAGYGDAVGGQPSPKERNLMIWINTVRASPATFQGAYVTRGCSFASFERAAKEPKPPLHFNRVLSQAAQKHSGDMAAADFVSHVGLDESTPFDRMDEAGYLRGYRGENICAGMKNPFDCVLSFMCSEAHRENLMSDQFREMGVALSSNLASQYKHYWTLNLGHAGVVDQGRFVSSFDGGRGAEGGKMRTLSVGAHRPEEPIDEVLFAASFHDEARAPPTFISVVANGVEFPLELKYGEIHHGLYEQSVQLLSIPMWQVLSGSAPCIIYHFRAMGKDGLVHRFPELGSYGFGGCDFDDPLAKWVQFQNETALRFPARRDLRPPQAISSPSVRSFSGTQEDSWRGGLRAAEGICLTDLHICADGSIVQRQPPSCQFHCRSGDPARTPTELGFLKLNGQKSFGGLHTCARNWGQFWSGIWNWCPDILDEAWNDSENQYRWLIPLWKELQKIDWVAASNAMTDFWQNMQQCKTYSPGGGPEGNLMEGFAISSIRIDQGQAVSNMQRVIVKSDVRYERYTSMKLFLRHKFMLDDTVVEKSILLGNSSTALGEVVFDDFAGAPMPGWWGSWFETFARTVWKDVRGNLEPQQQQQQRRQQSQDPIQQHFAILNEGRQVPIRAPEEALMHFSDKSPTAPSSSAGIWELVLTHDDPVASAAISDWDLMICGETVSTSMNFTGSETHQCGAAAISHPMCSEEEEVGQTSSPSCARRFERAMRTCGSVSTVGGTSTQPPPASAAGGATAAAGSILRIADVMHIQPSPGSSMYCSNEPVVQEGWAKPRYVNKLLSPLSRDHNLSLSFNHAIVIVILIVILIIPGKPKY